MSIERNVLEVMECDGAAIFATPRTQTKPDGQPDTQGRLDGKGCTARLVHHLEQNQIGAGG